MSASAPDAAGGEAGSPAPRPTGEAAAAMLAGAVGLLTLGGANLLASAFGVFEETLALTGRFFVPGGTQLGPYAGKEIVALVAWLGSWALLHWRLRRRQVSLTRTIGIFSVCLVLSTLLLWPPIVHILLTLGR